MILLAGAVWVYHLPRGLGSFNGLLVCVFQWIVCVWLFFGDSVDWWLRGVSKTCVDMIEP